MQPQPKWIQATIVLKAYVLKISTNLNTILRDSDSTDTLLPKFLSVPSVLNGTHAIVDSPGHLDTVIETGIAFYQGFDPRDSDRSHLSGSTVAQGHPERSKHHWKPEKQLGKGENLQKYTKIKDFMKSEVDF